jgi:hypothetical protein
VGLRLLRRLGGPAPPGHTATGPNTTTAAGRSRVLDPAGKFDAAGRLLGGRAITLALSAFVFGIFASTTAHVVFDVTGFAVGSADFINPAILSASPAGAGARRSLRLGQVSVAGRTVPLPANMAVGSYAVFTWPRRR